MNQPAPSEIIQATAVLFDVGHTILFPDDAFFYKLAQKHGGTMDRERFLLLGAQAKDTAYRENPSSPYKIWFRDWMLGAGVPEEAMPQIYDAIWQRHQEKHLWDTLEPSIPQVFKALRDRGFLLGVVSNADGSVPGILEQLELDHFFKCILDSTLVGIEKPDARIFLMAAEQLGVPPEQCVYVGDQVAVDVHGASHAGMIPVLLDPCDVVQDAPCRRIRRLLELVDYVRFVK